MGITGWIGAGGDEDGPQGAQPGGFAGFLGSHRADPAEGRTLDEVLGRARRSGRPEQVPDDDSRAANLMARGLVPGQVSGLSAQLSEAESRLAKEQARLAEGARREKNVARMREAGQLTALEAWQRLDGDFGDQATADRLERRVMRLRDQLAEAQKMIAPAAQRAPDPVEAASRHAHRVYVETTRAQLAALDHRAPSDPAPMPARQPGPRPFGSISRGGAGEDEPDCPECRQAGATAEESFLIHSDPMPLAVPDGWTPDAPGVQRASGREITRTAVMP